MTLCRKAHVAIIGTAGIVILLAFPCFAAEEGGFNRHTWDLIMKLVNFSILAFVIYKYGKAPLLNFIAGKRASVVVSFEELDKERQELAREQEERNLLLDQLDGKIKSIKEYYHQLGQDEKARILERAAVHRDRLLEEAEQRTSREFEEARKRFRAEVVDLAVQLAEDRVKQHITEEDQMGLVSLYINQIGGLRTSGK